MRAGRRDRPARLAAALALALSVGALTSCSTAPSSPQPFSIALEPASSLTSAEADAFQAAADRWSQVIVGDLPDVLANIPAGTCEVSTSAGTLVRLPLTPFRGVIDDLRITVWVGSIDGPGGILGVGGPCLYRDNGGLPAYGVMALDANDLDLLTDTVLHEMGHVLGIGAPATASDLWSSLVTGASTNDPRFTGSHAVQAWQLLQATGDVPLENCLDRQPGSCSAGTALVHWRESIFGNELMTGWLTPGGSPLSRVTLGALEDMGYRVDEQQADAYQLPLGLLAAGEPTGRQDVFRFIRPAGTLPTLP